ncbi:N-acetylmuramoyl-L-alanine amidase family protein [Deinococcus peraridilitoris]|uniref:N-acetylmuramoyl-L-alanine amidase n=1 Tax=Deinococcus peraridilitoris (strain DSM 19664 / LMG 22246 / CIP 109416 / KR-200) TaxID=937777 RepID=K9ZYJ9_DEIPD|nr:N-acetylmuramoyl-L-alanine amidase [Deinococcus peraridilitoris]AFZ66007.1 N-acetylmuramoyl-L-alanine amidase [Deinococcus peraridilitoris DSM 19664]
MYRSTLWSALFSLGTSLAAPPDIYVAYPPINHSVPFDHVLFEGSVPPGASLRIDGRVVNTGPDGLFIEWLPLRSGLNTLRLESTLGPERSVRTYPVRSVPPQVLAAKPTAIAPDSVTPITDVRWYGPALGNQSVTVSFRGSPGGQASFRLGSLGPFPMRERTATDFPGSTSLPPGLYEGSLVLPGAISLQDAVITVTLTGADQGRASARAPGTLSVGGEARTGIVTVEDVGRGVNAGTAVARHGAGGNFIVFLKNGMKFTVIGEEGNTYRAQLAPGQTVNLLKSQVRLLPGAPLPRVSFSRIETRRVPEGGAEFVQIRVPLSDRVPFTVEQTSGRYDQHLDVRLYQTRAEVDAIVSAFPDTVVRDVRWVQEQDGVARIRIELAGPQQWGYTTFFDGTTLVVQLRGPPTVSPPRPLEGRRILIDPGHGGSESGGAGALRVNEKDLMLPLSLRLAEKLRSLGATVTMTRTADLTVPLYLRPLQAENEGAEVLLSVHANALPDGVDPKRYRGAGVYYYWPQARPLADALLASLLQRVPEVGNDGIHYQNLALTRPSAQLSVLIETAYLTDPDNLRLLMSASGQERLADALARGLEDFYRAQTLPRR